MGERESYDILTQKIKSLGDIKEVLRDVVKIKQILSYHGDRHLICAFYDEVNKALATGEVTSDDLNFFRSGQLMDSIVNLERTVQETNPRPLFTAERLDKINYVSLINDPLTLAVSYTHPTIIDALCYEATYDSNPSDLTYWKKSGTFHGLPSNVKSIIVSAVLQKGNIEVAQQLLSESTNGLLPYSNSEPQNFTR